MARATIKLKRPITQLEVDLDENSLEAVGFMRMSSDSPECFEQKTHYDEIKAMSVEELAKHICCPYDQCIDLDMPCSKCVLSWLKAPVEEKE